MTYEVPIRVAFSGGRTSGLMLHRLLQEYSTNDLIITFANTGREMEETLQFVRDIEKYWKVSVRWVEYTQTSDPVVRMKGAKPVIGCHGFKEVTFETASRKGEPFEAIINVKKQFREQTSKKPAILPNVTDRWCSGELKHRTMDRFMRSIGHLTYSIAVGLRYDEPHRVAKLKAQDSTKLSYVFPLYDAHTEVQEVLDFWHTQPFDLRLPNDPELGTYAGNCDFCFLKRKAKLARMHIEQPERIQWWADQELRTGATFRRNGLTFLQMVQRSEQLSCELDVDLGDCLCTD
jgi:3'-phosphoadenosine 5'-phosphosulfate sulfotransferase (PAPS reductase)/FAD synthetase